MRGDGSTVSQYKAVGHKIENIKSGYRSDDGAYIFAFVVGGPGFGYTWFVWSLPSTADIKNAGRGVNMGSGRADSIEEASTAASARFDEVY